MEEDDDDDRFLGFGLAKGEEEKSCGLFFGGDFTENMREAEEEESLRLPVELAAGNLRENLGLIP